MQLMDIFRTRFGTDIIAEFMLPRRPSDKVAILTSGAPGYPGNKRDVMEMLSREGYWSFVPRYRGTWESGGRFLEFPPTDDVFVLMDQIPGGFRELWSGGDYRIEHPEFYLLGGSFGGPAALIASKDERVRKAATISAVVDWRQQENTVEPLGVMSEYVPNAFGEAYRADPLVWQKLAGGGFYNPIDEKNGMDGKKLMLFHAKDDKVVHSWPAEEFAKGIGAQLVLFNDGGHMGVGRAAEPRIGKRVLKFFRER